MVALTKRGWQHVQIDGAKKLQKTWMDEDGENRVDAYFGTLRDGNGTPVVIMNVYIQGAGARRTVDEDCEVYENVFTTCDKETGNEYYKRLVRHGFRKAE